VGHPGAEEGGGGGTGSLFVNFLSALVDIIIEIPVRWVMGIPSWPFSVFFLYYFLWTLRIGIAFDVGVARVRNR
jgi:hypothetical protein